MSKRCKCKCVEYIPYQVCPLCNGIGKVLADGFTSNVYDTCPVCSGFRVITMSLTIKND